MNIIFYKQVGYFNLLYRGLVLKFYKKILKRKIIKFNTTSNTNYNIYSWDKAGSEVFVKNAFIDWGNEHFFLETLKDRPKKIFLDVGCHTGYFVCLFKNIFNRIIGFEPSGKCFESLELLKSENNNFSYHKCFLGNENKEIITEQFADGWAKDKNDLSGIMDYHRDKNSFEEKLSVHKLDDFLKHKKINDEISAIKIDVDGLDLDVVKGAMETIKNFRPSILIEHYSQDLISTMNKIDYQVFAFTTFKDKPYNLVLEKLEVYDSNLSFRFTETEKKALKMTVCVPSEYVPKLSYPIKIQGNILFGINKKKIFKIFS